jgi:hypothetical protein
MTREQLESLYEELLEEAKHCQAGTVADERLDAQLCLIEQMLEITLQ